jgi:hypothetical protein
LSHLFAVKMIDSSSTGDRCSPELETASRAPRKISTYGLMTGVRDPGAADRSILDLSSRLSVAPVFLAAALIDALTHTETHDAPVHLVAVAILSRQMKRRML